MGDIGVERVEAGDELSQSEDIVEGNVEALRGLFPEAFTEDGIDFDVLRQLLGDDVAEGDEKFGLNWHGKRDARRIAMTPSTGTLRPCPEESVDWETTQNLMIEGDNLEVLKLLQKSYSGKVKLIYIDPPYNTGKDFVYKDDYRDNIRNYLELTGQVDGEGRKLSTNVESSGRFHTDWLNMMYPRLKLARNLLRDDGVIFISIDEVEAPHLRQILSEVFGEENFVGNLIWQSRTSISDDVEISLNHNQTLVYSKSRDSLDYAGDPLDPSDYANPDDDPRGPWKLVPIDANKPGGRTYYAITNPATGVDYFPPEGRSWAINPEEFDRLVADGRIKFGKSDEAAPKRKLFLQERLSKGDSKTPSSLLLDAGTTKDGTGEVAELFGKGVFRYAKPLSLLERIMHFGVGTCETAVVMDLFAGSASSGHAVLRLNAGQGIDHRFIMVQIPEPVLESELDTAAAFCDELGAPRNLAEIAKERLRRAGVKVREEHPDWDGDAGFRVFKLDSSNIRAWSGDTADVEESLRLSLEHVVEGRTDGDLLYEVLLKLGLDLSVPIEERDSGGVSVSSVGGGVLMTCLVESLPASAIETVGAGITEWLSELDPAGDVTVVFRDSAFENDVAKTNMAAILEQAGVTTVRSI